MRSAAVVAASEANINMDGGDPYGMCKEGKKDKEEGIVKVSLSNRAVPASRLRAVGRGGP